MSNEEALKALQLEGGLEFHGEPLRLAKFMEGLEVATAALRKENASMKTYAIWKAHEVVGYISLTEEQVVALNSIPGIGVYFGFDATTNPEKYASETTMSDRYV